MTEKSGRRVADYRYAKTVQTHPSCAPCRTLGCAALSCHRAHLGAALLLSLTSVSEVYITLTQSVLLLCPGCRSCIPAVHTNTLTHTASQTTTTSSNDNTQAQLSLTPQRYTPTRQQPNPLQSIPPLPTALHRPHSPPQHTTDNRQYHRQGCTPQVREDSPPAALFCVHHCGTSGRTALSCVISCTLPQPCCTPAPE